MGMNSAGFKNFYNNSSKVAKQSDLDYFFDAWRAVYGWYFSESTPWSSTNPKYKMPAVCSLVRTGMLSRGCDATTADRVLKYFKKWYKDTYDR